MKANRAYYVVLFLGITGTVWGMVALSFGGGKRPSVLYEVTPGRDTVCDLHNQPCGSVFHQQFYFRNTKSIPIKLISMKVGCGCTSVEGFPQNLMPGERYPFYVNVNSGTDTSGDRLFLVGFGFDDKSHARAIIRTTLVKRVPDTVDFGYQLQGVETSKRISIVPTTNSENIVIRDVLYDHQYVVANFTNPPQAKPPRIDLRLRPNIPQGQFATNLKVSMVVRTDPAGNTSNVDAVSLIQGWIAKDVESQPKEVNFGPIDAYKSVRRTIRIYSPYGKRVLLLGATSEIPGAITISSKEESPDRTYCDAELELQTRFISDMELFTVRLQTRSDGKDETLAVNCYAGSLHN